MAQSRRPHPRPKLPKHIIFFHILPRLPVISLQRCRSVCKQWLKFLKTRMFADMHNRHLTNGSTLQLQPSLLFLSTEKPFEFRIIDFEAPDDGSIPLYHPLPFTADAYIIRALTSLHGLVCVGMSNTKRLDKDIVLWNPLTGEYKTLRKTNPYLELYFLYEMSSGFYYNAADDDYKLLILSSYDLGVHIYSLKSDSWRKVDSTHNYQTLSHFKHSFYGRKWGLSNGTWLNGNLYFLYERKRGSLILKFDTKIEKFSIIPIHHSLMDLDVKCLSMTVQKDIIHLSVKYETSRYVYSTNAYIQLWKMIGDNGNWEKVGDQYRVDNSLEPLHWIGNRTWLMIKNRRDMYEVDLKKGTCIKVARNKGRYVCTTYKNATVTYTESFMSIDRSI